MLQGGFGLGATRTYRNGAEEQGVHAQHYVAYHHQSKRKAESHRRKLV